MAEIFQPVPSDPPIVGNEKAMAALNIRFSPRWLKWFVDLIDELKSLIDENTTLQDVVNTLYPIGGVYISTLTTNPATLLGYGTWAAFGAGRVLVGRDSGDIDFDVSEETGGAKSNVVTHAGTAVADHASHTHDGASSLATPDLVAPDVTATGVSIRTGGPSATLTHSVTQPDNHTVSTVQPYIVVYMWKRTG